MSGRVAPVGVMREHRGAVSCSALSACGSAALSGSASGEVLVWAVDTRRVLFALPPSCTHGDKGILQVAFLPQRPDPATRGPGCAVHPPDAADFLTMGRDGCIRFWGTFADSGTPVAVADLAGTAAATSLPGVGPGRGVVSGTVETERGAAPPFPRPDADFGDNAFVQRPTRDVSFSWGEGAGRYTVRCVATLWHSSFTFCKFDLSAAAASAYLAVPSDSDDAVRLYTLWGPSWGTGSDSPQAEAEAEPPAPPPASSLFGGAAPPAPLTAAQRGIRRTNQAQVHLEGLVREAMQISGTRPEDVLVPAEYCCDVVAPADGVKTGVAMACALRLHGGHVLAFTGYESGHLAATLLSPSQGEALQQEHFKAHGEPVLAVSHADKSQGSDKFLLVTGGADTTVCVWGGAVKARPGSGGASFQLAPLHEITLAKAGAASVAFHPLNPRLFAVALWDHAVQVHDTKSGALLAKLLQHGEAVSTVTWGLRGPSDPLLLTASNDSTVALWDVYA